MSDRPSVQWDDVPKGGALFQPDYVERREKMIAIQENELRMMNALNTIATICFSMASGFVFLGVEFLWGASADGQIVRDEWQWLIVTLVGVVFFGIGGALAVWRRKSDVDYIWKRSKK